jgi:hypothetical protein
MAGSPPVCCDNTFGMGKFKQAANNAQLRRKVILPGTSDDH